MSSKNKIKINLMDKIAKGNLRELLKIDYLINYVNKMIIYLTLQKYYFIFLKSIKNSSMRERMLKIK
jgi:hypothetical protein